jgi:hypothetical protein
LGGISSTSKPANDVLAKSQIISGRRPNKTKYPRPKHTVEPIIEDDLLLEVD